MLSVATNDKTMSGPIINLLGITLNFSTGRIYILEERRTRLIEEITGIMKENAMTPGMASELKGKLLFVSSHFSGRHGRSYLAPFADRQCSGGAGKALVPGLSRALAAWLEILTTSPQTPSLYDPLDGSPSDYLRTPTGSTRIPILHHLASGGSASRERNRATERKSSSAAWWSRRSTCWSGRPARRTSS